MMMLDADYVWQDGDQGDDGRLIKMMIDDNGGYLEWRWVGVYFVLVRCCWCKLGVGGGFVWNW